MSIADRVRYPEFLSRVMTAEEAAALIPHGVNVGMSGFTGAGYPKEIPGALAANIKAAHERGEEFMIGLFTGASTAPELDGVLAEVDGVSFRTPYQSDPIMRRKINQGISEYADIHLSHLAPMIWAGSMGKLHTAVVEVTAIKEDGLLVPSSSIGNNKTFLDRAEQISRAMLASRAALRFCGLVRSRSPSVMSISSGMNSDFASKTRTTNWL